MNAKTCKRLRKMAHQMNRPEDPVRRLMVHPPHERRAKEEGFLHVTAVNDPRSFRGVYRWLKKNFHAVG